MPDNVIAFPPHVRNQMIARGRMALLDALERTVSNLHVAVVEAKTVNLPDATRIDMLERLVGVAREIDSCTRLLLVDLLPAPQFGNAEGPPHGGPPVSK